MCCDKDAAARAVTARWAGRIVVEGAGGHTFGRAAQRPAHPVGAFLASLPGPGHYDPALPGGAPGGAVFGTEAQRPAGPQEREGVPGAGAYEVAGGPGPGGFRFGTEPRRAGIDSLPAAADGPGPGAYEAGDAWRAGPGGVFGREAARPESAAEAHRRRVPGPGTYDPGLDPGPAVSFTRAAPPSSLDAAAARGAGLPGPGEYDAAEGGPGPAVSIGRAAREMHPEARGQALRPGPGQYTLRKDLDEEWAARAGPRAPGGVIGAEGRFGPEARKSVPGPGHYEAAAADGLVLSRGARCVIGTEVQRPPPAAAMAGGPGAGAYDVSGVSAGTLRMAAAAGAAFGREEQRPAARSDAPGVGTYDVAGASGWGCGGVSMGREQMRPLSAAELAWRGVPGVGQYDVAAAAAALAGSGAAAVFGEEARWAAGGEGTPGVGTYDLATAWIGACGVRRAACGGSEEVERCRAWGVRWARMPGSRVRVMRLWSSVSWACGLSRRAVESESRARRGLRACWARALRAASRLWRTRVAEPQRQP